jgi:hypothetical protein
MRKFKAFWMRLCDLISHRNADDIDAELESHIALDAEEAMRAGLSEQEARRQALIRLGGAEQARQAYRDRATLPWLESILRDIRYALRGFRRNPVFAVTAIVTLALGIGATAAVFSVVDRILFRPLPYAQDNRLFSVGLTAPIIPQEFMLGGSYYVWKDNQRPFTALTSDTGVNECDLTERNPQRLGCASIEQNFLPTLGISPILGRNFLPEEDRPNGPKVALISYSLWNSQYGRDTAILNRNIIGLVAALALSRVLKSLLFGIGPHDPVSFIAVTLLLALVAVAATLIPARLAMRVDPMTALRWE